MDRLIDLNKHHLVLNPHPKNLNAFKQHIPTVVNFFQTRKNVYYSITEEYGDNNSEDNLHLDIIIFLKGRIDNLLNKKFRNDELKYVKENMPNTVMNQKTGNPYYDLQNENGGKSPEYNLKKLIGYNFKEYNSEKYISSVNYNNLPEDININNCVEFYHQNKCEKKIFTKDEITLSPKNATYELLKWLKPKENYTITDEIIVDTAEDKYCWIQLSPYHRRQLLHQLRLMCGMGDEYDKEQLKNTMIKKVSDFEEAYNSVFKCRTYSSIDRYRHLYEKELLSKEEANHLIDMKLPENLTYCEKQEFFIKE